MPFTLEQFLDVFGGYNLAIWPLQIVAYGLGTLALVGAMRGCPRSSRVISMILAAFWLWTGLVYHGLFFSAINPVALLFGVLFALEAVLLVIDGAFRNKLAFRVPRDSYGLVGGL